jgi:hypothetical protein
MRFIPIEPPLPLKMLGGKAWMMGECSVFVSVDDDRYHLSIAHPSRYPTWDEIKEARENLLPIGKWFSMLLPPPQHYVNFHRNCFHLWELRDKELIGICSEGS